MRKNIASQVIGCQMVTAADGTAFTGSVTVAVTGDAGTQATGSVGSGACTHEGNGYHTYAPAQAETNYDLIAFTFTGTGAIPATVQVFTGANTRTELATVDSNVDAIKAVTDNLPDSGALSTIDGVVDAIKAVTDNLPDSGALSTIDGIVDAIKAVTDNLPDSGALASLATAADLATVAGYIDTEVAAIKAKTDNLPASPAADGSGMALGDGAITAAKIASAALLAAKFGGVAEPSGPADWGDDFLTVFAHVFAYYRNKVTQTADTETVRNDDDDADLISRSVSDNGTTLTKGEPS